MADARVAACGLVASVLSAALAGALAAPARALTVSTPAPLIGTAVEVTGSVPTGDYSYEPAAYVDWRDGPCPATAGAARTAAIGNTTRGLGVVEALSGTPESTPIVARVLIEQGIQRVCAYGGGGLLADQIEIAGSIAHPPYDQGKKVSFWAATGVQKVRNFHGSLQDGFGLQFQFSGAKAKSGMLTCKRKRFYLDRSRIKVASDGSVAYKGPLRADNSRNYATPVPLPYHGHAKLRAVAKIDYGRTPLTAPLTGSDADRGLGPWPQGVWGIPVFHVTAKWSAPGFKPFPGEKSCPASLVTLQNSSVTPPVMAGQGSASMATDPTAGNGQPAGQPL